jgi:hypothetical protein
MSDRRARASRRSARDRQAVISGHRTADDREAPRARFFFCTLPGFVAIRASVTEEDVHGDFFEEVRPGADFYGLTYDDLVREGAGEIEVDEDGRAYLLD